MRRKKVAAAARPKAWKADPSFDVVRFMAAFPGVVRGHMHTRYLANSCLAATRIGQMVLRAYGINSGPIAVTTWLMTVPYSELADRLGRFPTEDDGPFPDDVNCVVLGDASLKATPDNWNGHLALFIGGAVLCDLSIDQANRPQFGIVVRPAVLAVGRDFPEGKFAFRARCGGVVGMWQARPGNTGYRSAPDWADLKRHEKTAMLAIRELRGMGFNTLSAV